MIGIDSAPVTRTKTFGKPDYPGPSIQDDPKGTAERERHRSMKENSKKTGAPCPGCEPPEGAQQESDPAASPPGDPERQALPRCMTCCFVSNSSKDTLASQIRKFY